MRPLFRDPTLQRQFEQLGYVVVDLMQEDDLRALEALYDSLSQTPYPATYAFSLTELPEYRRQVFMALRRLFPSRLASVLDAVRVVGGNFWCKAPRSSGSTVDVHQDWSIVDERRYYSVNLWCPLHAVDESNGCLAVVPGSHRLNDHLRGGFGTPYSPELLAHMAERYSRRLALSAGQVVMSDMRLFHWSPPNLSQARRLAVQCFVAPSEAPFLFAHLDNERLPGRLELFPVDDDFMITFAPGTRPAESGEMTVVEHVVEPLSPERLEQTLGRPDVGAIDR
jgi:hypothetical protein